MKNARRFLPMVLLLIYDAFCVVLSLSAAALIEFSYYQNALNAMLSHAAYYVSSAVVLTWIVGMIFKRYTMILGHVSLSDVMYQAISVVTAYALFYIAHCLPSLLYAFGVNPSFFCFDFQINKIMFFVVSMVLTLILTILGRSALIIWRRFYTKVVMSRKKARRILIFGAGEAGVFFMRKQENHPEDLLKPVVFIDDNEQLIGRRISGLMVYGNRDKLAEAIDKFNIDEVVVAIPTATKELFQFAFKVCQEKRCRIQRFGKLDDVDLNKASLTNIHYEDLLHREGVRLNMEAVNAFIKDKTVMVTGGVGSIGSEICRQVLKFGCKKLIIYDFNENGLYHINNELLEFCDPCRYELRLGSIRDVARLDEVMDEFCPQVVFHAAAHKHVPMMEINPREAIKNNIFGTYKTAKAAIRHKVEKFILISTDKAVNPTNIMGATKRCAELVIQMLDTLSDTDFAAVRFGNVLGSAGSVVPFFQNQINKGGPVTVTHPDMRRYFMTIPEAVQLVLEAGAMATGGEIFVLEMGEPVKIYDLACDLIRLAGYEPGKDIAIEFTGLRPGEKLFEEIHLDAEDCDQTANKKIVVLKPVKSKVDQLTADLNELEQLVNEDDFPALFRKVKAIVPTFSHEDRRLG